LFGRELQRRRKNRWRTKNGVSSFFSRSENYSDPDFSVFEARLGLQQIVFAGGSPAATFFSCLAKKRTQKKATAAPLNSRCHEGKSGKQKKLAALRQLLFLIRFYLPDSGSVASGKMRCG
jgi:hypothetical protein